MSDRTLAARVMFGCADARDRTSQKRMSRAGLSGIALLGTRAPEQLGRQLRAVRRAAPGVPPIIASDEEGGTVQRLADLLGPLPSAETMGSWPPAKVRRTATRYARGMARLGVLMDLAPVADLRVPGSYMDYWDRSFGRNPYRVGRHVTAWSDGLRAGGVIAVPKHWPGHGHAVNTHKYAARIPPYRVLRTSDLIPFEMAFERGAEAVMVGHLQSRGLTPRDVPATQSAHAMRVLRREAGPDAVIITDSLSMAASSSARGLTKAQAVVAALDAGVDWALICTRRTTRIVGVVARAIGDGRLDRAQLVASAARIDALRESVNR